MPMSTALDDAEKIIVLSNAFQKGEITSQSYRWELGVFLSPGTVIALAQLCLDQEAELDALARNRDES